MTATATAKVGDFVCHKSPSGYGIVSEKSGTQLGLFYKEAESCKKAIGATREGFVCAPMNGGSALYSIKVEEPLGNSWFDSLDECLTSLKEAANSIVCVVVDKSLVRFSASGLKVNDKTYRSLGECSVGLKTLAQGIICRVSSVGYQIIDLASGKIMGDEGYAKESSCQKALAKRTDLYICAPESGGAAVMSLKTGKKLGNGHYAHLNNCIASLEKAANGVICSANEGGSSLYRLSDGAMIGEGMYSNTHNCWNAISSIKDDVVCAPGGGRVHPFNVTTNLRLPNTSTYNNLVSCRNAH